MAVLTGRSFIQVHVSGEASGQRIDNTAYYWCESPNGTGTLEDFTTAFRTEWRDSFLPLIHDSYTVLAYSTRVIANLISQPATATKPLRTQLRYNDQHLLPGAGAPDKGTISEAALPTFVGVGCAKICSRARTMANTYVAAGYKALRGSTRIGPISQAQLNAPDKNELLPAYVVTAGLAFENRKTLVGGGNSFFEIVISRMQDKQLWIFGGVPQFVFADVSSYKVNDFATSQVSRKQSLSNLG